MRPTGTVEGFVDRGRVLDTWMDSQRAGNRVTLFALLPALEHVGFVAEATNVASGLVARRVFLRNEEGLDVVNEDVGARRLARLHAPRRLRVLKFLVALLIVGMSACTSEPVSDSSSVACEPITPSQLPSGADPVKEDEYSDDEARYVVWGTGQDRVAEAIGINKSAELEDQLPDDDPQRVEVRGERAIVIPVGDPPLGQITIGWTSAACDYTVWIGPGFTLEEALSYAGKF